MTNEPKPPILLASASPRRRELLQQLSIPFDVFVPDVDETPHPGELPASFALRMAYEKAGAAVRLNDPAPPVVLAADTVVTVDGLILGKPVDSTGAVQMLAMLSGKTHSVITGVCLWQKRSDHTMISGQAVTTRVTFRSLTADEINAYVASGEPMDKAGAYAIQGGAAGMVSGITGSWSNVVGLPMEIIAKWLGHTGHQIRSSQPEYPAAQSEDWNG